MDFSRLKNNIIDVIYENQIKLGYRSESMHLFYPLNSLNNFLDTSLDSEGMSNLLTIFCNETANEFGNVEISYKNDRFCFRFPPLTSEYVHKNYNDGGFLSDFINTVSKHNIKIEDIITVFYKYSDDISIEKTTGDFDYLVYFTNGLPNDYRYCFTIEEHHIIYHRFTIQDYNDL